MRSYALLTFEAAELRARDTMRPNISMRTQQGERLHEETIEQFTESLASGAPVPGGGAAAAVEASLGAALVGMVCNLTIGKERYRAHEATMMRVQSEVETLRTNALSLADEDATAFACVAATYKLPKVTDEEQRIRSSQIQKALTSATDVPLRIVRLAVRIVELCAEILDGSNPNVRSDIGVGAISAQAAFEGAALNVKVNLTMITDASFKADVKSELDRLLASGRKLAIEVIRAVEERVSS
jgi:methenyltetrahydrofolate cyclohydrolase